MCGTCGCHEVVDIHESLLEGNDRRAAHLRQHFAEDGVTALNLMGSPGCGKTSLLEATARALRRRWRMAAVSGDLATDRDGARLRAAGLPAMTITTGQACHLDAKMIHDALHRASWGEVDYFFIENVGNLVCPAVFDLGQTANVVLVAVTEGEDKPLKYPKAFQLAKVAIITKLDLLPHLDFDLAGAIRNARDVNPLLRFFFLSARTGAGMEDWLAFLRARVAERRRPVPV
jgi:hydrogenase nickel incorporation protein HypB